MSDYDYITARVAGSRFGYNGEVYHRGEVLEVHAEALDRHPNTLERAPDATVDEDADADEGSDDELTADDLDPHPDDLTIDELGERLTDVDDVALLETIKEAEAESGARQGALDAIDDRLAELEE